MKTGKTISLTFSDCEKLAYSYIRNNEKPDFNKLRKVYNANTLNLLMILINIFQQLVETGVSIKLSINDYKINISNNRIALAKKNIASLKKSLKEYSKSQRMYYALATKWMHQSHEQQERVERLQKQYKAKEWMVGRAQHKMFNSLDLIDQINSDPEYRYLKRGAQAEDLDSAEYKMYMKDYERFKKIELKANKLTENYIQLKNKIEKLYKEMENAAFESADAFEQQLYFESLGRFNRLKSQTLDEIINSDKQKVELEKEFIASKERESTFLKIIFIDSFIGE